MALRREALGGPGRLRRLAVEAVGAGVVDVADLDDFVDECDRLGGIAAPRAQDFVADFRLRFHTEVDTRLDGFSPDYVDQQLALYREVSGREIDQEANEQTAVDIDALTAVANPYGTDDVTRIAHHARTILTTVLVADVPAGARVLDMGCGWGLSTEMLGFCGATVTALDINPSFCELVGRRSAARSLDVTTVVAAFDGIRSRDVFDLVLFYECLHHAIRPADLLMHLAGSVAPGGKIALAGEPIQTEFWPHWGLRLDPQSVYCIRKFGWFENGWSAEHLRACFAQAGFDLSLFPGIGFMHGHVGVAVRIDDEVIAPTPHWAVPPTPDPVPVPPPGGVERVARAVARRIFR